jgi:TAG lipase/lysophosphatidylethanolamine acyltransferase
LSTRRFLLDENVPGASLTLVPELSAGDFFKLVENPPKDGVDYWILRGERSVWPAVGALQVRCAIEVELDRGYQLVRRRKPFDPVQGTGLRKSGSPGVARKRPRAASVGGSESLAKRPSLHTS